MKKFKDIGFTVRMLVGGLILFHGLIRIVAINSYIEFVLSNFSESFANSSVLVLGAALFPFLEFFIGMMIIFKVALKKTIWIGLLISIVMSFFILLGSMYVRLIYHISVVVLLVVLYSRIKNDDVKRPRII